MASLMMKPVVLAILALFVANSLQQAPPPPPLQFVGINFVRELLNPTTAQITMRVGTSVQIEGLVIRFGLNAFEIQNLEVTDIEYLQTDINVLNFQDMVDPVNSCPLVDSDGTIVRLGPGEVRCGSLILESNTMGTPFNYFVDPGTGQLFNVLDFIVFDIFPNCDEEPGCIDQSNTVDYMRFTITIPPGTPLGAIVIWGPAGPLSQDPQFAISSDIDVEFSIVEDPPVATPVPVPAPEAGPAPVPTPAVMKSDPHLLGLRGQTFDFHGTPGKIYNIIAEASPSTILEKLFVNALMGVAYATAISTEISGSGPVAGQGTWMKSIGIVLGGSNTIEVLHYPTPGIHACRNANAKRVVDACIKHGGLRINGAEVTSVGEVALNLRSLSRSAPSSSGLASVEVMNSLSFTRFSITVPTMKSVVDIVSPPKAWNTAPEESPEYSHLNFQIERLSVIYAMGVLGETSRIYYDADGNKVMTSHGPNGEGLLLFPAEQYEVPSLVSEISYPDP